MCLLSLGAFTLGESFSGGCVLQLAFPGVPACFEASPMLKPTCLLFQLLELASL